MRFKAPLLLLVLLSACATKPMHQREWLRVQTPHFEIVSALSEEETRTLASNAELFHATAEYVIQSQLPTPSVPTTVFAFDDRGIRRPFALRGEASHFQPTQRGLDIVLRTGGGWRGDATQDVRRDYMRYLLENHGGYGNHLWFDEGFSQLMSTVEARGDHVDLGQFRADYIELLRSESWIPVLRVLRTENLEDYGSRRRPLFMAECWAIVHWLYFGQDKPGHGRKQLDRYFDSIAQGYSYEESIERGFGRSAASLDRAVHKYIRSPRFDAAGVRFADLELPASYNPETMKKEDAFNRLGWLLIELGRPGPAEDWFERAVAADPNAARAYAGMGRAAALRKDWDKAQSQLEHALALEPNDSLNRLDFGIYYRDRAADTEDVEQRAKLAEDARTQLRLSWGLDDSRPEPYAVYGSTFLLEGQDPSRGLAALQRAHGMLPSDQEIELELARLYLAIGQPVRAKQLALEAFSNTTSKPIRDRAEELVEQIDEERATAPAPAAGGTQ